jgi:hypothetical protein
MVRRTQKPIHCGNRRKPAPRHSKTVIERKDARYRELLSSNISEEEALLNSQIGDLERTILHKTRMSVQMPMRKIHRDIAKETGRSNAKLQFEIFRDFHLATGRWSRDWTEAWRDWCLRSLTYDDAIRRRDRAQAYWLR